MVLEKLYTTDFVNSHRPVILILAVVASIFGIFGSMVLFRDSAPAFVSVGLCSVILVVTLNREILRLVFPSAKKNPNGIAFLKDHIGLALKFSYIFIGVMFTYAVYSLFLPGRAAENLFDTQYAQSIAHSAINLFIPGLIMPIFINNLIVAISCLVLSFLFGIRSVFLYIIVWNASVLGVVFGTVSQETANGVQHLRIALFLVILIAALPHIVLEILSYLVMGIIGEGMSSIIIDKKRSISEWIGTFSQLGLIACFILAAATFLENTYAPLILRIFLGT